MVEPRFDSVSSTPEPTPESSQLPELPHSPAPQLEKPSAEEVARAAIEAAVANGITSITTTTTTNKVVETTEPSSPNANSVAATATATAATTVKTEETIREVIADAKETTTTTTTTTTATKTVNGNNNEEEATAAAINNSSNSNSSNSAPASSTAKEPGKQPKELPDGQLGANGNSSSLEEHKQKKLDANTADLPPGVLYRVKATYGYVKEDVDELSFEIGDTIRVIEYDDTEYQVMLSKLSTMLANPCTVFHLFPQSLRINAYARCPSKCTRMHIYSTQ
ncbi:uncharacterized protein LOC132793904 [Drosophila nasuta]|uniref:uncharacterized protein LOC132793904 n=1 Tax=Drosophila nasuta TaxID=42062 RepID=UPI00295E5F30|nr:uncharacterized protein LOC132793904 [Drosophila nasuta]